MAHIFRENLAFHSAYKANFEQNYTTFKDEAELRSFIDN